MSHSCPICGLNCHCGGDIDDCCMDWTPEAENCSHCDDEHDLPEDYDEEADFMGFCVICGAKPCECAE